MLPCRQDIAQRTGQFNVKQKYLYLRFILVRTLNMRSTLLNLSVQYIIFDYRYNVVQQVSRVYLLASLKICACWLLTSHFRSLPQPQQSPFHFFESINMMILDNSCEWNHAVFVFLVTGLC